MKAQILRYWLAMNATAFDSAVHAVVLFCGLAGAAQATGSVTAMDLRQLGWIFIIAFGRSLLAYLDAHPVSQSLLLTSAATISTKIGDGGNASTSRAPEPTAVPALNQSVATPKI